MNDFFYPLPTPHLALAGDGLVEQQAAAILLLQAGVVGPRRASSSSSSAGAPEGLEAVGRERRGRRGRVGLVAGGRPAPVAPRGAVAGRREGTHRAVVFPGAVQTLCGGGDPPRTERTKENIKKERQHTKVKTTDRAELGTFSRVSSASLQEGERNVSHRHCVANVGSTRPSPLRLVSHVRDDPPALLLIGTEEIKGCFNVAAVWKDKSKVFFYFRSKASFPLIVTPCVGKAWGTLECVCVCGVCIYFNAPSRSEKQKWFTNNNKEKFL